MFGLLSSLLATKPAKARSSYLLRVESLEERWCLDASHISLNAVVQPGHVVELTGSISGEQVAGINVWFSGAVSGSTSTDSNGNFTYSTSNASLGTVSAVGLDSMWMQMTDSAQATIAVDTPTLTLSIASVSKTTVTLTGHVTDIDAAGRSVMFMGAASGSATTDSNGNFIFTTSASSLGSISASMTDLWGKISNTATVSLASTVPVIESFLAVHGTGDLWTFSGHVADEDAAGLTIYFGGLTSLAGQSVVVDENGNFSFTCTVSESDLGGTATAITTDWWGLESQQAWSAVG